MSRRKNRKLSEEDLREVEEFIYRKNDEEEKFLSSMFVNVKCKNENQKKLVDSIKNNQITIVSGLPGTGKTFIACAEALRIVKARTKYKKILLVKSVTQLPGEELGFLPGDLKEKLEPYMISFIDNFEKIIGETMTRKLRELGIISIQPLAFVRGRSIDNTVIIVDEAQNISVSNMRTLMTRIGNDSKMVILGDVTSRVSSVPVPGTKPCMPYMTRQLTGVFMPLVLGFQRSLARLSHTFSTTKLLGSPQVTQSPIPV